MPDLAMNEDQVVAYLARIGAQRPDRPTRAALDRLHRSHLLAVPFENLDIHNGEHNELDRDLVFAKVVERRRGGWCFELNSLFAALLTALGFEVDLLAARVARDDATFGPPFEHVALRVHVAGETVPLLADVGFGEAFMTPVPIVTDLHHDDGDHRVRLVTGVDGRIYEDDRTGRWTPRYTFADSAHRLDEFAAMSEWLQTSPESHFTRQRICSLATEAGRISLSDDWLIERIDGTRTETVVADPVRVLRERFGITADVT